MLDPDPGPGREDGMCQVGSRFAIVPDTVQAQTHLTVLLGRTEPRHCPSPSTLKGRMEIKPGPRTNKSPQERLRETFRSLLAVNRNGIYVGSLEFQGTLTSPWGIL